MILSFDYLQNILSPPVYLMNSISELPLPFISKYPLDFTSQCKIACLRREATVSERCQSPFRSHEIYSDKERINISLPLSSHLTVEQALDKAIRL